VAVHPDGLATVGVLLREPALGSFPVVALLADNGSGATL
jgi:hypothetical protein